ncbi:ParA family protein [Clostridium botulinum]|uniref:ParA family protein n=1 Tax=Clostridium botulinum TaxID=1491 RepID=UPI0007DFF843|nr:AAA family ATPase [Clostridium botulinum]KEI92422.1 hypothetical protein N491_11360 [Clostridium botulinum B2 275]NFD57572.1 ParA family protein [Clostridium botulinum]
MLNDNKNIVSFLNMKGGVCKTTLCKEMALNLTQNYNKRILVIDIDPQSNCTQSFYERYNIIKNNDDDELIKEKSTLPSIENIFTKSSGRLTEPNLKQIIYELDSALHIIPGSLDTIFMERETTNGSDQRLLNFIKEKELDKKYDYIFIDCPPTYSFYTVSALLASNYYLVPLVPDIYSLLGLNLLEDVVMNLSHAYKSIVEHNPIENLGVIFTKVPVNPLKNMDRNIVQIRQAFKHLYFFENNFQNSDKLATNKLETFIIDRDDSALLSNINSICEEFEKRMRELNEGE